MQVSLMLARNPEKSPNAMRAQMALQLTQVKMHQLNFIQVLVYAASGTLIKSQFVQPLYMNMDTN